MKSIILAGFLSLAIGMPTAVYAEAKTKEVCKVKKDAAGKEVKKCKTIKVHKKLEGTKVPPK